MVLIQYYLQTSQHIHNDLDNSKGHIENLTLTLRHIHTATADRY